MPQIIARNQRARGRQNCKALHTGWGRAVMKGPFCAIPFYTADHPPFQENDSCSKIRTNRVARTLLSAAFELVKVDSGPRLPPAPQKMPRFLVPLIFLTLEIGSKLQRNPP